ncbi:MAG: Ger(x)C family spore germination protein [Negativicutes bacterium]|nr:Ger(x)C family spore germination protein [Negativicutes bacterium]
MHKRLSIRLALGIILLLLTVTVSGCWDRKEIENRGYVLGVAIDYATGEHNKRKSEFLYAPQGAGQRKYLVTMQLPKFRKEASKEISSAQQHLIWAAEGESMFAITRAINTKVYFAMFFEDIQIIIFSEAVAREGIGSIIDFWLRDAEIRRKVKLFVTPGRAEDILKTKLQVEEVNSMFIAKLTQNVNKSPYFVSKPVIGEISEAMRDKRSFVMPLVMVEEKEVKLTRAAVFNKQQKMIGEFDEFEVYGAKLLKRELKQGVIVVPNPSDTKRIAVFELYEADIEVKPHLAGDKLRFLVEAKFTGTLAENQAAGQDALDPVFTKAIEQAVAAEYTRLVNKAYIKQQDLKVEVCGLGKLVYNKYPQYWKSIKERWEEEIFPQTPLDIKIKVTVRRPVLKR